MPTKPCKCRYDAAGHKILSHPDMLLYYKNDARSLNYVRALMPFRYVCLPTIEIHVSPGTPPSVHLYLIYPGETKEIDVVPSVRALEGLRATFRGRKGWGHRISEYGVVVLRREGRVILDPKKRFGVWNPERKVTL